MEGSFVDGDSGRIGGVPNRGGLSPNDSFSAEESADSAGPGSDDAVSARPASGVCVAGESSSWPGVGIWRTAGSGACIEDGTGEPSRAVLSARVTCDSAGETRPESRDEEGTACGFDDSGRSAAILARDVVFPAGVEACTAGFGYQSTTLAMQDVDMDRRSCEEETARARRPFTGAEKTPGDF